MGKANVFTLYDKVTNTAQYCVSCSETKKCAVIDCVLEYTPEIGKTSTIHVEKIADYIKENKFDLEWILETHAHADHISGAAALKNLLGIGKIAIGQGISDVQKAFKNIYNLPTTFCEDGSQFNHLFKDGEIFNIGKLEVRVMSTPGHTPACVSYYIPEDCVFVGDTIFMPDQGTARCDFPLGSAELLWDSVQKLMSLPQQTRVFSCHDYQPGGRQPAWESTIAEQKEKNIHIKEGTKMEEFIKFRTTRDATLPQPKLIIPSIQVNINGGFFPQPEQNGVVYMKVPVNTWFTAKDGKGAVSKD